MVQSQELTLDDFERAGWLAAIAQCQRALCTEEYTYALRRLAIELTDRKDERAAVGIRLLADVTSYRLQVHSRTNPLTFVGQMGGMRGATPEDLTDSDVDILTAIIPAAEDPELKARIADTVWVRGRDYRAGREAVDAYIDSSRRLAQDQHPTPGLDRLERALHISAELQQPQEQKAVVREILHQLNELRPDAQDRRPLRLMKMLRSCNTEEPERRVAFCRDTAEDAEGNHNWDGARLYWEEQAGWYSVMGQDEDARTSLIRAAETHVGRALDVATRSRHPYTLAAHSIKAAIAALLGIRGTKERRDRLHRELLEYQQLSTGEMDGIEIPYDPSELIHRTIQGISGRTLVGALWYLATECGPPRVDQLRKSAEESLSEHPLQSLFGVRYTDAHGRTTQRVPAMTDSASGAHGRITLNQMYAHSSLAQSVTVNGFIEPARRQIIVEHAIGLVDWQPLVSGNPVIPRGHELIFAKGLHAGLFGEFLEAAHLLLPQIESLLRHVLTQLGEFVSVPGEIQEVHLLEKMLSNPKLDDWCGPDVAFALRCLLTREGLNLRNQAEHGLLTSSAFQDVAFRYLWWIVFRLVVLSHPGLSSAEGEEREQV